MVNNKQLTDCEGSQGCAEERVVLTGERVEWSDIDGCCHSLVSKSVHSEELKLLCMNVALLDEFKGLFHC